VAAVLLGACTMPGPNYRRHDVPWLESWSSKAPTLPRGRRRLQSARKTKHGGYFNDPVLDHLIAEARRRNPACGWPATHS
jgi:hypothetical protein